MKVVFGCITAVAFFILLGTIGALETGLIGFETAILRMCIGAPVMIASFIIAKTR